MSEVIYKDRQGGQWVYWMDDYDGGGRIYLKPGAIQRLIRKGYRLVELVR